MKLGNSLGGATLEKRFPEDVETPSEGSREAVDDMLLKESENNFILN